MLHAALIIHSFGFFICMVYTLVTSDLAECCSFGWLFLFFAY